MRWDDRFGWSPRIEVPKTKAADLRHKVKQLTTRQTLHWSLDDLLQKLNPILRGWAHFYCYCTGAKDVLGGRTGTWAIVSGAGCGRSTPRPLCGGCFVTVARADTGQRGGSGAASGSSSTKWAG